MYIYLDIDRHMDVAPALLRWKRRRVADQYIPTYIYMYIYIHIHRHSKIWIDRWT